MGGGQVGPQWFPFVIVAKDAPLCCYKLNVIRHPMLLDGTRLSIHTRYPWYVEWKASICICVVGGWEKMQISSLINMNGRAQESPKRKNGKDENLQRIQAAILSLLIAWGFRKRVKRRPVEVSIRLLLFQHPIPSLMPEATRKSRSTEVQLTTAFA